MSKTFDIFCVDQPMVDVTVTATNDDLVELGIPKGTGCLVNKEQRDNILALFKDRVRVNCVGGSGLNTIKTIAGFGKRTAFVGAVGDDEYGKKIKTKFSELKIYSDLYVHDRPTGVCICMVTEDGERTMAADLGGARINEQKDKIMDYVAASRIMHLCGYLWENKHERETVTEAMQTAKRERTAVSFDVSDPLVVQKYQKDFANIVRNYADIIFANASEAKSLYSRSPQEAAFNIQSLNKCAVIKLGKKGALIGNRDEQFRIAPIKTSVVDTTGAGDMFAAGFLYGITCNLPLPIAGYYGALLSTNVISNYGAVLSNDIFNKLQSKRHFVFQ